VLNTCANPNCREAFRYLHNGKLFRLQTEVKGSSSEIRNPEYFWLCSRCAETMSLRLAEDRQVAVVDASESGFAESCGEGLHSSRSPQGIAAQLSTNPEAIHFAGGLGAAPAGA
jgi:hypothetical protein